MCLAYPEALFHLLRLTSSALWEEHGSHVNARESPKKALGNYQHSHDLDRVMQMCQQPEWKCLKLTAQVTWEKAAFRSWERLTVGESRV